MGDVNRIMVITDVTSFEVFSHTVKKALRSQVKFLSIQSMVYCPTTSIFDAELLEEGIKRNRPLKNRSFIIYHVANIFRSLLRSYNSTN